MKKRDLKGLSSGIASSFISRNNSINGYWALGILYKESRKLKVNYIKMNILKLQIEPKIVNAEQSMEKYNKWLFTQLEVHDFNKNKISEVLIELFFDKTPNNLEKLYKNVWGNPFICIVTIVDNVNKKHSVSVKSCCREHDPSREMGGILDN